MKDFLLFLILTSENHSRFLTENNNMMKNHLTGSPLLSGSRNYMSESETPPRSRRGRVSRGTRQRETTESGKSEQGAASMDFISKKLAKLDTRRQVLAKRLDEAQKSSDYENFQRIGNSYLGTILESINLYIDLIREMSSDPVAGELKTEFSDIVKKGSNTKGIEGAASPAGTVRRAQVNRGRLQSTRRSGNAGGLS